MISDITYGEIKVITRLKTYARVSLETTPAYFACRTLNLGASIKVNKNMHILLLMRRRKARVRRLFIANTDGI